MSSRRRRTAHDAPDPDLTGHNGDGNDNDSGLSDEGETQLGASGEDEAALARKLVRYALACEHARVPIRRDDVRKKVLGQHNRAFNRVFAQAQEQLAKVFGMEMEELPVREKRTLREKQKQKASARNKNSSAPTTSRAYILVSVLPPSLRHPSIIGPSLAPSSREEAEFIALYTTIISLIVLSGGELSDAKLRRHLTRLNAGKNTPVDSTENLLLRLARLGYVDRVVERADGNAGGDEDQVSWCVGPRGKVEVSNQSIAAFVAEVWGEERESAEFRRKLGKSLGGMEDGEPAAAAAAAAAGAFAGENGGG